MVAHCDCCGEEMIGDNDHTCQHTRIRELEEALTMALKIIDNAAPDAWKNGNEYQGVDEGDILTFREVGRIRDILERKKP